MRCDRLDSVLENSRKIDALIMRTQMLSALKILPACPYLLQPK